MDGENGNDGGEADARDIVDFLAATVADEGSTPIQEAGYINT